MAQAALAQRPGHGGAVVKLNADGSAENRALGFWPESLDSYAPTTAVGKLRGAFVSAIKVAQMYDERNQARMIAKATSTTALLPEPAARVREARQQQAELRRLRDQMAALATQTFDAKLGLQSKILDEHSPSNLVALAKRQELRAIMRGMDEKERLAAIENRLSFRTAALETEAEASGLSRPMHQHFMEEEIKRRFPQQVAEIQATSEALGIVDQIVRTATSAVENELTTLNEPLSEPVAPPASKPWA